MAVSQSTLRVGIDSNPAVSGGRRAQGALRGVGRQATVTEQRVRSLGTSFLSLQGAMLGLTAGTGLVMGVRVLASFGQEMATTRAITNATTAEFERMNAVALELGRTTRFTSTQAAEGLLFLGRAGFSASEGAEALPGVLNLAQAGAMDLGSAADIATNILTGFSMEVEQTARVVDVMTATVNSSNTDMRMLGDAMKYVAPVANTFGISIEETAAAIGNLSNAGLQGSMAGTGLRGVLARLEAPSAQLTRDLEAMGISLEEVRPSAVGMTAAIQRLVEAGAQGRGLELFEQRAGPAFEVLAANIQNVRDMTANLNDAGGTAERVAGVMDDTLNGSLLRLNSAVQGLVHSIGSQGGESGLRGMVDALTGAFTFLSDNAGIVTGVITALTLRAMVPLVGMIGTAVIPSLTMMSTSLQLMTVRGGAALVMTQALRTGLMLLGGPVGIAVGVISLLAFEMIRQANAADRANASLEDYRSDADATARSIRQMNTELGIANPVEEVGRAAQRYSPQVRELAAAMEGVTEEMVAQAIARRNAAEQALYARQIENQREINDLREQEEDIIVRLGRAEAMRSQVRGLSRDQLFNLGSRTNAARTSEELVAIRDEIQERTDEIEELGENVTRLVLTPIEDTIQRIRAELNEPLVDDTGGNALSVAEQRIQSTIDQLQAQRTILEQEGELNREIVANLLDAGLSADASGPQAQRIRELTTALFELEEAESTAEDSSRGRLATFEAQREQLQENIRLMGLSADARQEEMRLSRIEQTLQQADIELTGEQRRELAGLIALERQMSEITKERDRVIQDATEPLREYTNRMAALNQAMAMHPQFADLFQQEMRETQLSFLEATVAMGQGTFADAFLVELARMSEGARNLNQSLAQSFVQVGESISRGLGDSIGRAIVYSEDLGSALQDVARQAIAQLISSLVQLGIQYAINATIGNAIGQAATAASVAQAQVVAGAWSNAAAMVSLATMGANAIPAAAGIASTVALSSALASVPGFKSGGYTGSGNPNDVAGVVHKGEFVSDAETTARYRPLLEALSGGNPRAARSTPVDFGGSAGAGDVYLDFDITVNGANKSGPEIVDEISAKLVPKIKEVARMVIMNEKRPGGALSTG